MRGIKVADASIVEFPRFDLAFSIAILRQYI